jgi:RecB family endonuclease NucS
LFAAPFDRRLIIIEIKRPSHTLDVEDLNQLERYVRICRNTENVASFEALLVRSRVSEELRGTLDMRSKSFKVRTYTELVSDTRRRYTSYLKALEDGSAG